MILAYIDPGSGSILIQVIVATCIGGIVVIGGIALCWKIIKFLFVGKKPDGAQKPEDSPGPK